MGGGDDEADYVARAQTELRGALAAMSDLEAVLGDKFAEDLVEEPVANADSEVCQLRAELEKIREDYAQLSCEKTSLSEALDAEREKNETCQRNLSELESISGRLQTEVLSMDQEKLRLNNMVKSTQEENEVLGKVMEKISCDYDDLKRLFDQQTKQIRPDQKDDKIRALRNTARALESENELLSKERAHLEGERRALGAQLEVEKGRVLAALEDSADLRNELQAKNSERAQLLERFGRLESEKLNVLRQLTTVQSELDAAETRIKDLVAVEETARLLTEERTATASRYESKIMEMQREMEARLEEINSVQKEEVESAKGRYLKLFEEKAEELHALRDEHAKATKQLAENKERIADLEYREEELQRLLSKSRSGAVDEEIKEKSVEVEAEVVALRAHAAKVEEEVETARAQYDKLQESYRSSVALLQERLLDISGLLNAQKDDEHSCEIDNRTVAENGLGLYESDSSQMISPRFREPVTSHIEYPLDNQPSSPRDQSAEQQPKSESLAGGRRKRGRKKNRKRSAVRN